MIFVLRFIPMGCNSIQIFITKFKSMTPRETGPGGSWGQRLITQFGIRQKVLNYYCDWLCTYGKIMWMFTLKTQGSENNEPGLYLDR